MIATYAGLVLLMLSGLPIFEDLMAVNLGGVGPPLLVPLAIPNWCALTAPTRNRRILLGPVIFLGLLTFFAAEGMEANSMLAVPIILGSALAAQAWAPLRRGRREAVNTPPQRNESAHSDWHRQPHQLRSLVTVE